MVDAKVGINSVESYADSCFSRAQRHMETQNWRQAIAELKEAIKGDTRKSEYYALLGVVYFNQQLNGMARVYLGQALKLNPSNELAYLYSSKLALANGSQVLQKFKEHNTPRVKIEKAGFLNKVLSFPI